MYKELNNSSTFEVLHLCKYKFLETYIVTETLDTLKTCLGNENAGINVLREILTAGFSKRSIGIIPKIYDSVSYGDINRSVIKNAKALFLMGVNEGVFPNVPVTTGILSNDEREYLISRGISVAPDSKKLIEDAGRLNVPGRPIQYRTTPDFLRTFGIKLESDGKSS